MVAASLPPPPPPSLPPPPPPRRGRRVLRSFRCPDELWTALEARARELGCSTDWLIAEAMKREIGRGVERSGAAAIALSCGASRVIVDRERVVIGRSAKDADLVLRHPAVSRQHAIVERLGAVFVVVDMASTNGVVVDGKKSVRAIIAPGDAFAIGPFTIAVERA